MAKTSKPAAAPAASDPKPAAAPAAPVEPAAPAAQPRLLIVTEGYTLFWPIPGLPRRGEAGSVVREDDPFLDAAGFAPAQRYKLRPASEEEAKLLTLTPCNNRVIAERLPQLGIDWLPLVDALIPQPPKPPPDAAATEGFEVPAIDPEPPRGVEP